MHPTLFGIQKLCKDWGPYRRAICRFLVWPSRYSLLPQCICFASKNPPSTRSNVSSNRIFFKISTNAQTSLRYSRAEPTLQIAHHAHRSRCSNRFQRQIAQTAMERLLRAPQATAQSHQIPCLVLVFSSQAAADLPAEPSLLLDGALVHICLQHAWASEPGRAHQAHHRVSVSRSAGTPETRCEDERESDLRCALADHVAICFTHCLPGVELVAIIQQEETDRARLWSV